MPQAIRSALRVLLWLGVGLICLCLLPFIGMVGSSGYTYIKYRSQIAEIVDSTELGQRSLPQPVADMLLKRLNGNPTIYEVQLLIGRLEVDPITGHTRRALDYYRWYFMSKLFLSQQEQLVVIAHLGHFNRAGPGLYQAAQFEFGLPLSQMSTEQIYQLLHHRHL